MSSINQRVLVSDANHFNDSHAINSHMDSQVPVSLQKAKAEHSQIKSMFESAGIEVHQVPSPASSQDGVYTANWALVAGNKAIMSNLPNKRASEEPYAEAALKNLGLQTIKLPPELPFSGQGDALPCGDYIFVGSQYRTSPDVWPIIERELGKKVIGVQAVPELDSDYKPVTNPVTGWPDSFFYDLDLAVAVIKPNLIAWCPEALTPESQAKIKSLSDINKIEVSMQEAKEGFACNLVSTGQTVIMSAHAPLLKADLEAHGLKVISPQVTELLKGGGFIRCVSLTF